MVHILSVFVFLHSAIICLLYAQELRYLGSSYMPAPAFSVLFTHEETEDFTERYSIIISTFALVPGTTEEVNFLRYPGKYLDNPSNCNYSVIGGDFVWPRKPGHLPESVFGSNQFIHVTDGFIPPTKQDGSVYICDVRDEQNIIITDVIRSDDDNTEWFYQMAGWKDADGDGVLDMFTCRTRLQTIPSAVYSEFLWFKNTGGNDPGTDPWEIGLVISQNDCDTFFTQTTLQVDGETFDVIFTTGYFMNKLSVYWTTTGLWNNANQIESRVIGTLIDDAECVPGEGLCGHFFDVKLIDLNLDGNLDLVLTINSEVYGHLIVYEIPADFRTDEFVPVVLAEGFIPRIGMDNQGAPGLLQSFYPSESVTGKPWILLSGDDDGRSYYLVPSSQLPDDWSYSLFTIFDGGPDFTMGGSIAFDSNGDGFTEIFVATYSADQILFYTFAPVSNNSTSL